MAREKRPGEQTVEEAIREWRAITTPKEPKRRMMNVTRYIPLLQASDLAIRLNELYEASRIVESCGASPELTNAVIMLGERMRKIQIDLELAIEDVIRFDE